jgi:hypothetical protein
MQAIQERVGDRAVLSLVRTLLRAGVLQGGSLRRGVAGTPQGGVVSRYSPTSTCTGWTGRGVARTGRWRGMPMIVRHERGWRLRCRRS